MSSVIDLILMVIGAVIVVAVGALFAICFAIAAYVGATQ